MAKDSYRKNKFMFSFGTFGRDIVFTLINMFLLVYLEKINVSKTVMGAVGIIMLVMGIFDACNDPIMGLIVDNTKSRFGKFKPWIFIGGIFTSLFTVLLFTKLSSSDTVTIALFAVCYFLWTISWTLNDIPYWSMLPSLSKDPAEREVTSSLARIFASLGTFAVAVAVVPITNALDKSANDSRGYTLFAVGAVCIMLFTLCFTIFGVKEHPESTVPKQKTGLKDMFRAIVKNDQLLLCGLAMIPFAIGAVTTVSFGTFYFKYAYGDETMFSVLAVIMGAASILSIACFPLLCKWLKRKQLFAISLVLLVIGYLTFFFAPNTNIFIIGIGALLLFIGQSLIQVTLLVCLADIVEYGEYKLGKRNESVTFSVQSFISKVSGAIASAIVAFTLILAGISSDGTTAEVSEQGIWILKTFMFIVPLLLILMGAFIILFKYKIDEKFYKHIVKELEKRNEAAAIPPGEIVDRELVSYIDPLQTPEEPQEPESLESAPQDNPPQPE